MTLADKAKLIESLCQKDDGETQTLYERCYQVGVRLTDLEYPRRVEAEEAEGYYLKVAASRQAKLNG